MSGDLWLAASADTEAEQAHLRMGRAKVAVASLWPFLAMARTAGEFEHRLALAEEQITAKVEPEMIGSVVASLREDFSRMSSVHTAETHGRLPGEWHDMKEPFQGSDHLPGEYRSGEEKPFHPGEEGMYGSWPYSEPQHGMSVEDYDPGKHDHAIHSQNSLQFFHAGLGRWMALDDDANKGKGNPAYPPKMVEGPPEQGPETWETGTFPQFPGGPDNHYDPINAQYDHEAPQPWVVPPGGEWKESPMSFAPYKASQRGSRTAGSGSVYGEPVATCPNCGASHRMDNICGNCGREPWPGGSSGRKQEKTSASRLPFAQAAEVLKTDRCEDCGHPVEHVKTTDGDRFWSHGGEYGQMADADHMPWPSGRTAAYFDQGSEGVAGDQQAGFPADVALDEPDYQVDSYGEGDPQPSSGTTGEGIDSQYHSGSLAPNVFYDPNDRSVRMVRVADAGADPFGSGNPFTPPNSTGMSEQSGDSTAPPPVMTGGPGAQAMPSMTPQTTPPAQMPGGGGGAMPGTANTPTPPTMTGARRHVGESRNVFSDDDPTGLGDDFAEHQIETQQKQRPRQAPNGPGGRNTTTPQSQRKPIPTLTTSVPAPGGEEGDDEEED